MIPSDNITIRLISEDDVADAFSISKKQLRELIENRVLPIGFVCHSTGIRDMDKCIIIEKRLNAWLEAYDITHKNITENSTISEIKIDNQKRSDKDAEASFSKKSKLQKLIAAHGYNFSEYSKVLGKSAGFISTRMSGKIPWRLDEIYKLCENLNISYNEIHEYFPNVYGEKKKKKRYTITQTTGTNMKMDLNTHTSFEDFEKKLIEHQEKLRKLKDEK